MSVSDASGLEFCHRHRIESQSLNANKYKIIVHFLREGCINLHGNTLITYINIRD